MAETLRMVVAVIGNVASVSLYAAPTYVNVTFHHSKIVFVSAFSTLNAKASSQENEETLAFKGYLQKGHKEEKHRGVFMHSLHHSTAELSPFHLVKVAMTAVPVLIVFCVIAVVSAFVFPDHRHRKLLVGSIGLGVSIAMYASPLVVMKKVIQTKSVEFMPLPLSFCSFLASVLWLTYGLLIRDIFVAGPSVIGTPLGILQLVLHCKYWKRRVTEEPTKVELQKGNNAEKLDLENGHGKECVTVPSNFNS
ncbi:hypothetical protein JHK84_035651 [Glycine max]|nr:hypothetical protein JHK84_035651 [Glycine max]